MNWFYTFKALACLMLLTTSAYAQDKLTEHTFKLSEGAQPGQAKLVDVSWLIGSWQGTAFGSQFEEVWNPPSSGSMVGMFKLFDPNKGVDFYELMLLKESLINRFFNLQSDDIVGFESLNPLFFTIYQRLLKEQGNSIELWVKHFSADFKAWEDKADFVKFRLVKIEKNAVHFSGLSFYQNGNDQINGYIVMKHKDGNRTPHYVPTSQTIIKPIDWLP